MAIHIYVHDAGPAIFTYKYQAKDKDGKIVKFTVREPAGNNSNRYAWERAETICQQQGYTEMKGG